MWNPRCMHRVLGAFAHALLLNAACAGSGAENAPPLAPPAASTPSAPDVPAASAPPPAPAPVSKYPAPPPSKRGDTAATSYGIRVEDPYRWLENGKDPEVQAWVKAQNAYARKVLDGLPARAQ